MTVDEEGREVGVFLGEPIIENVPERITRWLWVYPDSGYATKEDALKGYLDCPGHNTLIKVEFEEGEHQ